MNAAALILAVQIAHKESRSAQPTAPVVPETITPERRAVATARHATARVLRRAADRVDPVRPTCG